MNETVMFLEAFEQLCKKAHQNSKDKGFWDEKVVERAERDEDGGQYFVKEKTRPVNIGEKFMLMVSEIAEAFEAHRKGQGDAPCDKDCTVIDPKSKEVCEYKCEMCNGSGMLDLVIRKVCHGCTGLGKVRNSGVRRLTNFEEEMADIIIRVADFCGWKGIDLGRVVLAKMAYNAGREKMHGKTC